MPVSVKSPREGSLSFANDIRKIVLEICSEKKTAHLGSALSVVDILTVLFLCQLANKNGAVGEKQANHLLLSKGHSALALYACLFKLGFLTEHQLNSYSDSGSIFEEHPNHKIPMVPFATGSLGHGLPYATGRALAEKINKTNNKFLC